MGALARRYGKAMGVRSETIDKLVNALQAAGYTVHSGEVGRGAWLIYAGHGADVSASVHVSNRGKLEIDGVDRAKVRDLIIEAGIGRKGVPDRGRR